MAAKPTPSDIIDDDVFELTDIVEKGAAASSKSTGLAMDLQDADVNFDLELEALFTDAGLETESAGPAPKPKAGSKPTASASTFDAFTLNAEDLDFDAALKEIATQDESDEIFGAGGKAKAKPAPTALDANFDMDVTGLDADLELAASASKAKPDAKTSFELSDDEDDLFKDLNLADFDLDSTPVPAKTAAKDVDEDPFADIDMSGLGDDLDLALGKAGKASAPDPDLGGLDEELDLFSPALDQKRPTKPAQPSGRDITAEDDVDISGLDELIAGLDLPETGDPLDAELKPAKPTAVKSPIPDQDAETEAFDVEIGDEGDDDIAAMLKFAEEESEENTATVEIQIELDDTLSASKGDDFDLPDFALDELGAEDAALLPGDEHKPAKLFPTELDTTVLTGEIAPQDASAYEQHDDLLSDIEDALGFDLGEAEAALAAAAAVKELSRKPNLLDEEMDQFSIDAALSGEPVEPFHDEELNRRVDELEDRIAAVQAGARVAEIKNPQADLDSRIDEVLARKWENAAAAWSETLENKLGELVEKKIAAESAALAEQVAARMGEIAQRKVIEEVEAKLENALSAGSEFTTRLAGLLTASAQLAVQEGLDARAHAFATLEGVDAALAELKQELSTEVAKAAADAAARIIRQEIAALASELA